MKRIFFSFLVVFLFSFSSLAETLTQTFIAHSISAHDGAFIEKETDLKIPGRGFDYEFRRTYRSRIEYNGPLGFNWDHNYNKRLVMQANGNVARFDGESRFDIYVKNADGTYAAPSGYFDTLIVAPDASDPKKMSGATITDKHATVNVYDSDGFISQIKDRNGNTMTFTYSPLLCKEGEGGDSSCKNLIAVTDTVGRVIRYTYNAQGKLTSITDFAGRTVQFGYDNNFDLVSVTNPAGNTMKYTYSSGYLDDRSELNHNLLTVTDAKGQTYLKNVYSIYDRVTEQTFGDEGKFLISYNQVATSLDCTADLVDKVFYRTEVTDRVGNKIDYQFNCQGNPLQMTRAKTTTKYAYNKDGLLTNLTKPNGNGSEYEYDAKGKVTVVIARPT